MGGLGSSPVICQSPSPSSAIWAPQVSARFSRTLLGAARDRLGTATVDQIVRSLGASPRELDDETAWLSLSFCEELCRRIVDRTGTSDVLIEAGRAAFSPRYFGFLYAFARAFASTELLFRKVVELSPVVNKVARFSLRHLSPGHVILEYVPVEGAPREKTNYMCMIRGAQLAAIPTVFGLPEARLVEHECHTRGGSRCVYELRWLPARRSVGLLVGLPFGLGLGLLAASLHWLPLPIPTAAALLTLLGGSLGALFDARREIVRRGKYLEEQNSALAASAEATERRFAEVVEAKREVDAKVEERTNELSDALARLQEVSRAKSDFFANVSHELRTPLTLILAPLEAMLQDATQASPDALGAMHRNSVRLLRLINELLDLAKVDAGGMRIAPAPTDVAALLRQIVAPFEALARERGIDLVLDVAPALPPVPLDPDRVDIAVANLLANALKFTPAGGRVTARLRSDAEDLVVSVTDTGPGIAPEDQARVFERFAQASQGPRRAGGTGIGLALVNEIAKLHGGSVALVSEAGAGATFELRLPLTESRIPAASLERRQAVVPVAETRRRTDVDPWAALAGSAGALAELSAERRRASSAPPPPPEVDARAPLVLVVEDHDELREFVARTLAARYRVVQARDGEEGLAAVAAHKPDLLVSDVMMPRLDGYELCRRLKADVSTRPIPVILLTAKTGVTRMVEGFAAGADDYLAKPFNARELLARVDVHLRVRALMAEVGQRERLAMLGVVSAGVAHEVRNPLTAIQAILPGVRRALAGAGQLDERTGQALEVVQDAVGRIERVTRDLLDLSRVDRDGARAWQPDAGIASALRLLRAGPRELCAVEFAPGADATVLGRPAELNQVIVNVLDNAFRAAGSTGHVRVTTRVEGGRCLIDVVDDGPGIPAAVLPRIFDPFFTTRMGGEGTGLGLSIAKKIVSDHLGTIVLDCPAGGGTHVTIGLPTERAQERVQSSLGGELAGRQ